jgi:hypothetical protein
MDLAQVHELGDLENKSHGSTRILSFLSFLL